MCTMYNKIILRFEAVPKHHMDLFVWGLFEPKRSKLRQLKFTSYVKKIICRLSWFIFINFAHNLLLKYAS